MTRVDATRRLAFSGTFAYTVAKPVGGDDVDDTSAELAAFDTLKQKLDDESALKTDLNANLAIDGNQASVTAAPAPTVGVGRGEHRGCRRGRQRLVRLLVAGDGLPRQRPRCGSRRLWLPD